MRTLDATTWHIMDAMADDWESIVQIRPYVEEFCGPTPEESIFDTLRSLHADRLIEIMEVGEHSNALFPPPETRERAWFAMTDTGRSLWDLHGGAYRDEPV